MYDLAHPHIFSSHITTFTAVNIAVYCTDMFAKWFLDLFNVPVNNFSVMSFERPLPGYYQYFWRENMSCSSTQHGVPNEDRV